MVLTPKQEEWFYHSYAGGDGSFSSTLKGGRNMEMYQVLMIVISILGLMVSFGMLIAFLATKK